MNAGLGLVASDITGLILAGGQGRRMGGVDKGLQPFRGEPLVCHALRRLAPQVGAVLINANRHLDTYATFGPRVVPDALPDYPGPLAGLLTGLNHCQTPWLVTVPCDAPYFPLDYVARLAAALSPTDDLAMVTTPDAGASGEPGRFHLQPVFGLLKRTLAPSLAAFMAQGERKVSRWMAQHACVHVPFLEVDAFVNLNTLAELDREPV